MQTEVILNTNQPVIQIGEFDQVFGGEMPILTPTSSD